jgi:hypothetical protein
MSVVEEGYVVSILVGLVESYQAANSTASAGRLSEEDRAYEAGFADGLTDGLDALRSSVAEVGRLGALNRAAEAVSSYDRGYRAALQDVEYIVQYGVLPGSGQ